MTSGSTRARAGWTFADQLVASSTNALLSIVVARSVDAIEFGAFALAFLVFAFAVGLVRALVTDPLLISHSGDEPAAQRLACARAAGASLVLGAMAGALCLVGAVVAPEAPGRVLQALAFVLPGLLLQDAWRRAFFALGRPRATFVNDLVWSVLQLSGVLLLIQAGQLEVAPLVLAWGVSGGLAAALGCLQIRRAPRPVQGMRWLWEQRALGGRLGTDFLISQGVFTVALAVISATAGLAVVGAIRAAQVLLAPVQVMLLALSSLALPLLATARVDAPRFRRVLRAITVAGAGCTALYCLPLLLIPDSVGWRLMGASWVGAESVLPLLSAQMLLIAVATGPALALKALARATALLRVSVIQAPILLVASVAGAELGRAPGAAAGFVLAHVVGTWVILGAVRGATAAVDGLDALPPSLPGGKDGGSEVKPQTQGASGEESRRETPAEDGTTAISRRAS
ncbi:hypothetical protein [Nocardioides pacificus]